MKSLKVLSVALMAIIVILFSYGCAGGENHSINNGDVVSDAGDDVSTGDKADDPSGVICENGMCCEGSVCWLDPDIHNGDTEGEAEDGGSEYCYNNEDCPNGKVCSMKAGDICVDCTKDSNCEEGFYCHLETFTCMDESVFEPFRWLEADWKCTQGNVVGEISPLNLLNWDDEEQVVIAEDLTPCNTWYIYLEEGVFRGYGETSSGKGQCLDAIFDKDKLEVTFESVYDEVSYGTWTYQQVQ